MKILLTGAEGQLGRALIPVLSGLGELVSCGRRELDLTDGATLEKHVAGLKPDLLVNAAAYTAVDAAESDPGLATRVNALAPGLLAMAVQSHGGAMIHFSTDYVFDGRKLAPWSESDCATPLNVYGRSKLAGEWAVRASGVPALIIRLSWLYDREGKNFLNTMLKLGAEREELAVVDDQWGAPTPVGEVAGIVGNILEKSRQPGSGSILQTDKWGVLHLACSGSTTWCRFAQEIFRQAEQVGMDLEVRHVRAITSKEYPVPAIRPHRSIFNLSRLQEVWDITPSPWQMALAATLSTTPTREL